MKKIFKTLLFLLVIFIATFLIFYSYQYISKKIEVSKFSGIYRNLAEQCLSKKNYNYCISSVNNIKDNNYKLLQNDKCLKNLSLGVSFPPVADNAEREFTKAHLDTLGVAKIRFAENWALREPIKGNYNWGPLDERINWANENNYKILLTIQSNGPDWACSRLKNKQSCIFNNNNDFKIYIDSLLQRYSGKISKIQFGNEWQSDYWYVGDANDYIDVNNILYDSVKNYSPSTQVVLGGFSAISLRFLAGCNGINTSFYDDEGNFIDSSNIKTKCSSPVIAKALNKIDLVLKNAKYDLLDLHFYDDVEQWDKYFEYFSNNLKPIIVSEFGGPNMKYEPYSEAYQEERLYQYINKLDNLKIKEAYYFKLVEGTDNPAHVTSGLINGSKLTEKLSYFIFKSFNDCLNKPK